MAAIQLAIPTQENHSVAKLFIIAGNFRTDLPAESFVQLE